MLSRAVDGGEEGGGFEKSIQALKTLSVSERENEELLRQFLKIK